MFSQKQQSKKQELREPLLPQVKKDGRITISKAGIEAFQLKLNQEFEQALIVYRTLLELSPPIDAPKSWLSSLISWKRFFELYLLSLLAITLGMWFVTDGLNTEDAVQDSILHAYIACAVYFSVMGLANFAIRYRYSEHPRTWLTWLALPLLPLISLVFILSNATFIRGSEDVILASIPLCAEQTRRLKNAFQVPSSVISDTQRILQENVLGQLVSLEDILKNAIAALPIADKEELQRNYFETTNDEALAYALSQHVIIQYLKNTHPNEKINENDLKGKKDDLYSERWQDYTLLPTQTQLITAAGECTSASNMVDDALTHVALGQAANRAGLQDIHTKIYGCKGMTITINQEKLNVLTRTLSLCGQQFFKAAAPQTIEKARQCVIS